MANSSRRVGADPREEGDVNTSTARDQALVAPGDDAASALADDDSRLRQTMFSQ